MLTAEALMQVNNDLKTIDMKGKAYVMVTERVKALRAICPDWTIMTQIIDLRDGVVVMQASISDEEGRVIATGLASEKDGSSYINKTSYIENCETSAVGRALGFLGIGIDASMASAEEVANAMLQQETAKRTKTPRDELLWYCNSHAIDLQAVAGDFGLTKASTDADYRAALEALKNER